MTENLSERERQRRAQIANVRQELLSPATALLGYASLLAEEAECQDDALSIDLENILLEAKNLLNRIDIIVSFTRHSDISRIDTDHRTEQIGTYTI